MSARTLFYRGSIVSLAGLLAAFDAPAEQPITPVVERALLEGDWAQVAELCKDNEVLAASPVLRGIGGHANLALNRNNESFLLLLSLASEGGQQHWLQWASAFAEANPDVWVGYYLKGDALARAGKWDDAVSCYDRAAKASQDNALVLNARGVGYATQGDRNLAREDFERACASRKPLADAYASFGNLQLMSKASPGARRSFDEALRINPSFALALNGRACARFGQNEWREAMKDFEAAARLLPLPLFLGNIQGVAVAFENLAAPGTEQSPRFRFTDFRDWQTLRELTMRERDVLRTLLGRPLPMVLGGEVIDAMNLALEKPLFYEEVKEQLGPACGSAEVQALVEQTKGAPFRATTEIGKQELESIVLLNRLVIELTYPNLIAQHRQRDPGMQLYVQHGQLQHGDKLEYMRSLPDQQLIAGRTRVEYLWRPAAEVIKDIPFPGAGAAGRLLERHLNTSVLAGNTVASERGLNLQTLQTGGVSAELRRGFVDRGEWPVVSWFGLAQGALGLERGESSQEGRAP